MLNSELSGIILLNKKKGHSSFREVKYIKKLLGQKTGHGGTLDPMAEGLLIIAIGKATRLLEYALEANKEYIFTLKWGEATDSYDATGKIIAKNSKIPNQAQIVEASKLFKGKIRQTPPIFSAVKIAGQAAYKYARNAEKVELKSREVIISDLELINHQEEYTKFRCSCSKGTYIRSLGVDIADKLRCLTHICFLQRTKTLGFTLEQAINLSYTDLEADKELLMKNLLKPEKLLHSLPDITLSGAEYDHFRHGRLIERNNLQLREKTIIKVSFKNIMVGIARIDKNFIYPIKVLVNQIN